MGGSEEHTGVGLHPGDTCPTCGAKMRWYHHRLNRALVAGIQKVAEHGDGVNLKDLGLTRNQWDNFQKLRYWGLVEGVRDAEGIRRRGVWRVTEQGRQFVAGRLSVPGGVWTYRGVTQRFDGDQVYVHQVGEKNYRRQEDYRRDAQALGRDVAPKPVRLVLGETMARLAQRLFSLGGEARGSAACADAEESDAMHRLKVWGLARSVEVDGRVEGWALTERGERFARGLLAVPNAMWAQGGESRAAKGRVVYIHEVRGVGR